MASYNRVVLLGHLTRDPEARQLQSGTLCGFSLAVNHRFKDREGNQKEEVCFVDCTAFGKTADAIAKYATKGRLLLVEGRLKLEQWTAKDGSKRSAHRVVVEQFQFMPDGKRDAGQTHDRAAMEAKGAPAKEEDIPF